VSISILLDMASTEHADRIAVGRRADGMSYAELSAAVAGGAGRLRSHNPRHVVFLGVNGPAFPLALFAAAHAGLAVTPLSYRLDESVVNALIRRLDRPLVLSDPAFESVAVTAGYPVLTTDSWLSDASRAPRAQPGPGDDAAPAVVLFTSGTTAIPKGVLLRHSHLVSYVLQTVEFGAADAADAALISVPPYHVAGVGTVLTNVYAGRRLVYLPDFDPRSWLDLVAAEEISQAMVVPTMLARIVDHLDGRPADAPALRSIAYGGARMPRPVLDAALRAFPDVGFVNAYGLTETSSTLAVLSPADHRAALASGDSAARARLGSAGRLVPGMEGQIRDAEGMPLPPGETGELWVRGDQVSGEYLGRGSALDADGWFPTRDCGYFDTGGYLFIEGRSDDVIIRGGENIAPAEIEDVLAAHPAVRDVVVIGLPDEEWGERIVAVIVLRPGHSPDPEELRAWTRRRLRGSRTPDQVAFRADLPRNATGKLLRREIAADLASA
jgi:acyl-CoA synthetase (AMP-forming)/AMP-acid ligase II